MEEEQWNEFNSAFASLMNERIQQQLENPTEALERSTNLETVLLGQVKNIQFAREPENRDKPSISNFDQLQHPLRPFHDLRPQDRLECSAIASAPNQVLSGKYLLCQTISPVTKVVGFSVVVTDPKGTSAMELCLYNYSSAEKSVLELNFDDILPPGSFLVLKNPAFILTFGGVFLLRCDNPAEVELVSKKRVEGKFPDLGWNSEVQLMTIQFFGKRHFWENFKDDEAAFVKLKGLGNKGFVDKRFSDAIRFYEMALDYCTKNPKDEAIINSNKTAALLALGCYNAALKCAELALEVDPSNEKYNYRKTKALIGLAKYEEALKFLVAQFEQFPSLSKNKDCKNLLDSVKFLSSRKKIGPTDSQLYLIRMKTLNKEDNIPEFVGPLAISQIEGKSRGLVATQDIRPGQLLICTKAFSYQAPSPGSNQGNNTLKIAIGNLVGKIANKLVFDPELGPQFYGLTANNALGHLEPTDWKIGQVDMKRISEIVKTNSFRTGTGSTMSPAETVGCWISPSFLNHSCSECNVVRYGSGEWVIVVAVEEIKQGDELTLAYVNTVFNNDERQRLSKSHGFICNCKLCQLEASEPMSVKNERQLILQSLGQLTPNSRPAEIEKALKDVEKLVSFRKDNVPLNYPLLSPQIVQLEQILVNKRRVGDDIWLLNRMFEVAAASGCWNFKAMDLALSLAACHAARGDNKLAKEWAATVKRLGVKFYGSLEASGLSFAELKKQTGIDFFK